LSKLNIFLFTFLLIGLTSCSHSVRFTSKENLPNGKTTRIDTVRITKNIKVAKDSLNYISRDEDFTQEEIRENDSEPTVKSEINLEEIFNKRKSLDSTSIPSIQEKIVMQVISYMGTPYKFGGNSRKGIDCSAFTQAIFNEAISLEIPRSTVYQKELGRGIEEKSELKFGDLIFFNTRKRQIPGHVGIYLWDNFFVHASTKNGVTISSLESGYYDKRFLYARRLEFFQN
jgi:cell wall-associated NlpC family hydrolase